MSLLTELKRRNVFRVALFYISEHRHQAMIDAGLPKYWRQHGFPPQCRPLGEEGFTCD